MQSYPKIEGSAKSLALIPLFSDVYVDSGTLKSLVHSALYSRLSALVNTDAPYLGVAVKFYIESTLRDHVSQTLVDNGIDLESDVIWFKIKKTDTPPAYLSKKMCAFYDDRFLNVERLFLWDADFFFLECRAPLFSKFLSLPAVFTAYRNRCLDDDYKASLARYVRQSDVSVDSILSGIGLEPLARTPADIEVPVGYFYSFPAQYFHRAYPDWIAWMRKYSLYLGGDEEVLAMSAAKFNFLVASFKERLGITIGSFFEIEQGVQMDAVHGVPASSQTLLSVLKLEKWTI